MTFTWKSFKIDLAQFLDFLQSNIPSSDGIYASEEYFEVIVKSPLSGEEVQLIQDYYDSLIEPV